MSDITERLRHTGWMHDTLAIRNEAADEIDRLRKSNNVLHRRCQDAEAALVDYAKLLALPPNGDGIRFVNGSMGRALLVGLCDKQQGEIETLRGALQRSPCPAALVKDDGTVADCVRKGHCGCENAPALKFGAALENPATSIEATPDGSPDGEPKRNRVPPLTVGRQIDGGAPTLSDRLAKYNELRAAAEAYYNDYCLDEAEGLFAGVIDGVAEQRDAARRLRDAIKATAFIRELLP